MTRPKFCLTKWAVRSCYDIVVFLTFAIFCFFTMQQMDLLHTGGSSFALLSGHILDFYDYNVPYVSVNNYMLPTYILFAIWNIPIRLLGLVKVPTLDVPVGVVLWYKTLPVLFYIVSGYLMYCIAMEMKMGEKKSRMCAYIFLTTPIAFFGQFCFGQYDIFTVFFMLLGILAYLRRRDLPFILWFGLSMTFKYFSLFIFMPMLLLREKNIWKLIRACMLAVIPLLIFNLPFIGSEAYRNGVLGFGALRYILSASFLNALDDTISIVIVLWVALCGWALLEHPANDKEEMKWALFLSNVVLFLIFGLGFWHPQWLLVMAPFMVLATMISTRADVFLILDLALMCVFSVYTVNRWPWHVDQDLFKLGILGRALINRETVAIMADLYIFKNTSLIYTMFSAIMAVSAFLRHPKYLEDDFSKSLDPNWGWVRVRFLVGVSFFVMPAFICFCINIRAPQYKNEAAAEYSGEIYDGKVVSQRFASDYAPNSNAGFLIETNEGRIRYYDDRENGVTTEKIR